jgi:hypothetical protein
MIKIIIPIISLDSILMIKNSGSGTPNDDQKQVFEDWCQPLYTSNFEHATSGGGNGQTQAGQQLHKIAKRSLCQFIMLHLLDPPIQ